MLQNSGNVDNLTGHYVFFLGCARGCHARPAQLSPPPRAYRALYLLNWIYRYFHEPGYRHWIGACDSAPTASSAAHQSRHTVWISGTVQTVFYCDFFYYYIKSWRNNEKLKLPA